MSLSVNRAKALSRRSGRLGWVGSVRPAASSSVK